MSDSAAHGTTVVTDPDQLRQVYASLLEPAFPPRELESVAWLVDGVAAGQVTVLVAEDASGPVAIGVTEPLAESGVVLLDYFATRADRRGQGLGSALFSSVMTGVLERDRPAAVVAEVERPDRHPGSPEYGDPTARLRFYGRHGAQVLDLPYFQPALHEGDEALHGMLLLLLWAQPEHLVDGGVPGPGLLAPAVAAMMAGQPSDEETTALREAAGRSVVPLYPTGEYEQVASSR